MITIVLVSATLWGSSPPTSVAEEIPSKAALDHTSPEEQYRLAMKFEKGTFGPPDFGMATYWLLRSARSGYAPAEAALGFLFDRGKGVSRDPARSAHWYFLAAQKGNPRAQTNLAWDYEHGEGISKDPEQAFFWYRKAAEKGYPRAENNLGTLYSKGLGVSRNDRKAFFWYKKAAYQNYAIAQTNLGIIYSSGMGVPQNHDKALLWLRKAADLGNRKAQDILGETTAPEAFPPFVASIHGKSESIGHKPKAVLTDSPETNPPDVDHPPLTDQEHPDDFALVIGVENYPDGLPSAEFALNDARSVFRMMLSMGIPANHIRQLSEGTATRSRMRSALGWIKRNASRDSTIWVYYSGHGALDPNGNAYLVPFDADPTDIDHTAYPMRDLFRSLTLMKVRRIVVALDSCFSGAGERSIMPEGLRPLKLVQKSDFFETDNETEHIAFFSASGPGQEAGIFKEARHGLFTYYFLRGMEGGAAKRGHVTVSELDLYLKKHVSRMASLQNREQTPGLSPEPTGTKTDFRLR
jgi:hypothetical protein